MSELDSPHVIKFVEFINTEPDHFFFVQELANGCNLKELLEKFGGCLTENVAKKVLLQIIKGFNHLYEHKVIHRDCKLENLLIHFPERSNKDTLPWKHIDLENEEFIIKIADFGYSRILGHEDAVEGWYGTPLLMAPEALFGKSYGHKRDVWALGAMYFQLITGKYIFGHDKCTLD
jgi:serine/threonine protein kinase